jgi:hypothetical protein
MAVNVRVGRKARGLREHCCRQCVTGWVPGTVKTFDPKCEGCQEKLAKGQRTGKEPMPYFRQNEKLVDNAFRAKNRAALAEIQAGKLSSPRVCCSR